MGITYFIGPITTELDDTEINGEQFLRNLQEEWPDAKVHSESDGNTTKIYWQLHFNDEMLYGEFWADKKTVLIEALSNYMNMTYAAQVAVWYREVVPSKFSLFIYDNVENFKPIEITTDTTVEQIIAALEQN